MPERFEHTSLLEDLQDAAAGDEDAWRRIVDEYAPRVFGLLRAQCNDPVLAEEITQSTFCTIVAKIEGYTEEGRFEQWLFRIAMNRLRDEMRRRKRHATPVGEEALKGFADSARSNRRGATDDTPRAESADLAALREALSKLPEADQRIIHLRHFGGLSFKQIAEMLDQPLGTVLARQHRALKKLKDILGPAMGEPPDE